MSNSDLTTEILHNLKSKLLHELLHVDTPDLSTLRRECHRDEEFYRNLRPHSKINLRNSVVNTIMDGDGSESETEELSLNEVCAFRSSDNTKCWNC